MAEPAQAHRAGGFLTVQSISRGTLADEVIVAIRELIVTGQLPPGQKFSHRKLAARLGVSFIPVREALRLLDVEGLLLLRPKASPIVTPLTHSDLTGICRVRRHLEPALAVRSGKFALAENLDQLDFRLAEAADELLPSGRQYDEYRAIYFELLRPAATDFEMRLMEMLYRATERYLRIRSNSIKDVSPVPGELADGLKDLIAGIRDQCAARTRDASLDLLGLQEHFGRQAIPR